MRRGSVETVGDGRSVEFYEPWETKKNLTPDEVKQITARVKQQIFREIGERRPPEPFPEKTPR